MESYTFSKIVEAEIGNKLRGTGYEVVSNLMASRDGYTTIHCSLKKEFEISESMENIIYSYILLGIDRRSMELSDAFKRQAKHDLQGKGLVSIAGAADDFLLINEIRRIIHYVGYSMKQEPTEEVARNIGREMAKNIKK